MVAEHADGRRPPRNDVLSAGRAVDERPRRLGHLQGRPRHDPAPEPIRIVLDSWIEPAAAWAELEREEPDLVWSDRSAASERRVSFLGFPAGGEDVLVCDADGLIRGTATHAPEADPLAAVCRELSRRLPIAASGTLGWWGWFGYELAAASVGVTMAPADEPLAAFVLTRHGIEFDHDARVATVVALDDDGWTTRTAARLGALPGRGAPEPAGRGPAAAVSLRHGRSAYLARIGRCLAGIAAGDAYLLCLTDRITVTAPGPIDAGLLHQRLHAALPAAHAGVVRVDGWALVSASPEQFLAVDEAGTATTRPIKGTRPRSADPVTDERSAEELRTSEKERAENLMIVDLMRNDLARVSDVGSVEVPELFVVESNPSVHSLVSAVRSSLSTSALAAIPALFPAGSMTGAPKRSAMQILAGLEDGPRGAYAGAWGRISVDGTMDLAVVIRSAMVHGATATVGTGGGITALSDPAEEWEEIMVKAAPILDALGAGLHEEPTT